ncbi:hypothetical protein ACN27G_19360 [Plantactinospora sp. WMMB334]|uniref:hypothetical protein n=1 Tax=Plantactinospora sp. WMMB334 TaxID=3404119 RepID=UPI003B92729D
MADPEEITPPPPNVTPPTLGIQTTWERDPGPEPRWFSGPKITVQDPVTTGGGGEAPEAVPDVRAFEVSTGDIEDRVIAMVSEAEGQVRDYNEFKAYVAARQGWIFSVGDESAIGADGDPYANEDSGYFPHMVSGMQQPQPAPDDHNGEYYGASREQVTQINTYMNNLLMACADVIHLVGQYALAVDNAGQIYANVDYASKFPDPPALTPIM